MHLCLSHICAQMTASFRGHLQCCVCEAYTLSDSVIVPMETIAIKTRCLRILHHVAYLFCVYF